MVTRRTDELEREVIRLAIRWWESNRPHGWDEARHLKAPSVNASTDEEAEFAVAIAELVKELRHAD